MLFKTVHHNVNGDFRLAQVKNEPNSTNKGNDITSTSPEPHIYNISTHNGLVGPVVHEGVFSEVQLCRQTHGVLSFPHETQY